MASRSSFGRRRGRRLSFGELRLAVLLGLALGLSAATAFDPAALATLDLGFPVARGEPVATQRFAVCGGARRDDCVVDGDTFRLNGAKIRIADIDTPETHPARCPREAELGARATRRLAELLSAGPFTLAVADRDTDRYGRKLRIVTRDGASLGDRLVAEGLARRWEGRRRPWCDAIAA